MPFKTRNFFNRRLPQLQKARDKLEGELQRLVEESCKTSDQVSEEFLKEIEEKKQEIQEKIKRISDEIDLIDTVTVREVHQEIRQEVSSHYRYLPLIFILPIIASFIYFLLDKIL
jgi:predicted RNA-binding protein Jag